MSTKRALLDVDPSIVERNLMITESHEDELKHLFPVSKDEYPSKLIKPSPGFCVKTRSIDNEKIFINICQTDAIPAPRDLSEEQLVEILQSETPSEFRVPMSIGDARPETDKSGNAATAYDIAIHPDFYLKVANNKLFKQFFLTVVFEGIQEKYSITIKTDDFAILKNRKAMGTLQLHRIQQREVDKKMNKEKKLIEEIEIPITPLVVESKKPQVSANSLKGNINDDGSKVPPYRLMKQEDVLVGDFYIPDIMSVKDLALDIGEDRVILESRKRGYLVDIFVPYLIKQKTARAQLNKNNGILTITMPIVQTA